MGHNALITPIRDWLIDKALEDSDIVSLFEETCLRMVSIGVPIDRARLFWPTLHPLFRGEMINWVRGEGAQLNQFVHRDVATDQWIRSPLRYVVENNLRSFRRRLTGSDPVTDFELLDEMKSDGYTDYLVLATRLKGNAFRVQADGFERGLMVTFSTKHTGGFSDEDIIALNDVQRQFAVTSKVIIQSRVTSNITGTYLGSRAGRYVLDGQIRRGDGIQTPAIIWFADMRNSTKQAETLEADAYFDLLNAFFAATAMPVVENGGEILDFIGDAVLGIFPFTDKADLATAARAANLAVAQAIQSAAEINKERGDSGLTPFKYGIALNKGGVKFGNIGIPSRLTFSVISPSVNEASRIESMTKHLGHAVLASKSFAQIIPDNWQSVGKFKLDGVAQENELFRFGPAI